MPLRYIKHNGSEFDVVIMVIPPSAPVLLTRNLLYTGITRAKKQLFISNHTTKAHVASIYKKLGVANRVQAAIKSVLLGADKYYNLKEKLSA